MQDFFMFTLSPNCTPTSIRLSGLTPYGNEMDVNIQVYASTQQSYYLNPCSRGIGCCGGLDY